MEALVAELIGDLVPVSDRMLDSPQSVDGGGRIGALAGERESLVRVCAAKQAYPRREASVSSPQSRALRRLRILAVGRIACETVSDAMGSARRGWLRVACRSRPRAHPEVRSLALRIAQWAAISASKWDTSTLECADFPAFAVSCGAPPFRDRIRLHRPGVARHLFGPGLFGGWVCGSTRQRGAILSNAKWSENRCWFCLFPERLLGHDAGVHHGT